LSPRNTSGQGNPAYEITRGVTERG
jgi:hypothetical protein